MNVVDMKESYRGFIGEICRYWEGVAQPPNIRWSAGTYGRCRRETRDIGKQWRPRLFAVKCMKDVREISGKHMEMPRRYREKKWKTYGRYGEM